jgi:hypothetical protein
MTTWLCESELGEFEALVASWTRSLRSPNPSPKTIRGYREAAELFVALARNAATRSASTTSPVSTSGPS